MKSCPNASSADSLITCQLVGPGVWLTPAGCEQCQAGWVRNVPPASIRDSSYLRRLSARGKMTSSRPAVRWAARALSLLAALGRWADDRFRLSSQRGGRWAQCMGCDLRRGGRGSWQTCAECGCFLTIKTALPRERCPVGKWLADPVEVWPVGKLTFIPEGADVQIPYVVPLHQQGCGCAGNLQRGQHA